jgi:hypothetical protein
VISLVSFLLLIFPFYQGTIRYFVFTYGNTTALSPNYSFQLMGDSVAFLIEAALFFVMSRALAPAHWVTYYGCVAVLLWVDSIWGLIAVKIHGSPIYDWIFLNMFFGLVVVVMLVRHKHLTDRQAIIIGLVAVFIRTVADYWLSWGFYFPSLTHA